MTVKKKVALSILAVVILLAVYFGYGIYEMAFVLIPNSYAAWITGDLIVEYMKTHSDRWPRSWDELRQAKESLKRQGRPIYWKFEELPQKIKIDWSADPVALAKAQSLSNEVPFQVVTKLDGSRVDARWGEDTEPNRKIYDYLKEKKGRSNDRQERVPANGVPQP